MLGTSRGRGEGSLQRRALREAAPLAERAGGERGEAFRSAPVSYTHLTLPTTPYV